MEILHPDCDGTAGEAQIDNKFLSKNIHSIKLQSKKIQHELLSMMGQTCLDVALSHGTQ